MQLPFFKNLRHLHEVTIMQRRKYYSQLSRSQIVVDRAFIRVSELYDYVDKYMGMSIPGSVLYVNPNPVDEQKAKLRLANELTGDLLLNKTTSIRSLYFSALNKSFNPVYSDIDIDTKNKDVLNEVLGIVKRDYVLIETNGGFHVLVENAKHTGDWRSEIRLLRRQYANEFEINTPKVGTPFYVPMPGTMQGNFMVTLK